MRALSLSNPWPWLMAHPDPEVRKNLENRSWPPSIDMIDQRIALHAAKSWDDAAVDLFIQWGLPLLERRDYVSSALVATVVIDRVVTETRTLTELQRRYFFEVRPDGKQNYGWLLRDVFVLPKPIGCAGRQGLWTLPDELESQVLSQLAKVPAHRGETHNYRCSNCGRGGHNARTCPGRGEASK